MTDPLPRHAGSVVLRRLAATDLRAFQAYRQDAGLGRYQGWAAIADREAHDFLSRMHQAPLLEPGIWCQIGISDAATLELIGDIGLFLAADTRHAEIGFTLRRQSHGSGFATAAVKGAMALVFELTPAEQIVGVADVRNVASIRLLERVGMLRVETRPAECHGEPCTEVVYAANKHYGG